MLGRRGNVGKHWLPVWETSLHSPPSCGRSAQHLLVQKTLPSQEVLATLAKTRPAMSSDVLTFSRRTRVFGMSMRRKMF